jgi:kynurenine formamidase
MPQFVELSHTIVEGMRTYPGLPEPRAEVLFDHAASRPRYGGESEFLIASLHLCGNTGTYVDSPFHRYPDGIDLAGLPLERLAQLEFVAVDARLNVGPRDRAPGTCRNRRGACEGEGRSGVHRLGAPLGTARLL